MPSFRRARGQARAHARLIDVARSARVSTASVSRALNTPQKVSPTLRARIQAALDKLRYVPNGAARALASSRTHTIGAIVPTLGIGIFAAGVVTLQQRLEEYGYTLLIANSGNDPELEARQVRKLVERGVDGVVLVGFRHRRETYDLLAKMRVPYVNTYVTRRNSHHPCIGFDQQAAAAQVVDYLIDLGHSEIGLICPPLEFSDRNVIRLRGFREAAERRGLPIPENLVAMHPYTVDGGRMALRALLQINPRLTAVACTMDMQAMGAVFEAHALGIRVPDKLSITGFDDLDPVAHLDPPLTTMHIPAAELGIAIADHLVARLNGRAVPRVTEVPAKLMVRASTGPVPAG